MFVNRLHFKAFSLVLVEYYCLLVIKSQTYSYLSFFRFDGGAVSSASTLAEGSPELVGGAVLVEVDVLGTFLFRPSRDVSMSLTERLRT